MRLLAGDRFGAAAAGLIVLLAACSSSPSTADDPADTPLSRTPAATPTLGPITDVTIVPLTAEPAEPTPIPDICPDPFLEGHPLFGTQAVRLNAVAEAPPVPARIETQTLAADGELERIVREALGEEVDRYAVVIKDLADGRGVSINADRLFYAASLFKLEVMYEIVRQAEAGAMDLAETYNLSDYYNRFGLGPRLTELCEDVTLERALVAMMSVSDNAAAVMLQDRAGPRNINNSMAALGLAATALLPENTLPTTAADMALLMEGIARGQAAGETGSARMVELMAGETINDRIPSGVPEGTRVAHKTGNWENATHDAGIVYGVRSTYVVVLMSDVGFDGDAASVQREIMRVAWEYFEGGG
jgi:beta-lactamase class A